MQISFKSIVASVLALGATQAFALTQGDIPVQPPAPTIPAAGLVASSDTQSPLLVAVWDPGDPSEPTPAPVSLVQYVGVNYGQLAPGGMSSPGVLDFGTLSNFSTAFANAIGDGQTSRLQFGVFAIDGVTIDGVGGLGLRTTGTGFDGFNDGFAIASATTQVMNYINAMNNSDTSVGCNKVNPCVATSESHPTYFGSTTYGSNLGTFGSASISGAVGTALSFYDIVTDENGGATSTAYAGKFLVGADGHVTYNVGGGNPVPLPAAAWLLLSGLGGLGVVGRRRRQAVAA